METVEGILQVEKENGDVLICDSAARRTDYEHGGGAGEFGEDYDTRVTEFAYTELGQQE